MTFLAKLLGKDSLHELRDAITNLELLADAEAQISEFYRLCAGAMEKEKGLWNHLADQELQHADKVRQMLGRITLNPGFYRSGISFSTVTIRMFGVEMQSLVRQMNRRSFSPDQLFAIALEIEESAIEVSYSKLVKTEDALFNMMAHQIDAESAEHKSAITSRMKATSAQ
jgi:rubrerythrin